MFESIFSSVNTSVSSGLSIKTALIALFASIVFGITIAYVYMKSGKYNKNFVITLSLLPLLVQVVIMMVNGNLGTSVAVLGAFSLVRFRSTPGNSRDIISIFFAMAVGLATGMGHILFAFVVTLIVGTLMLVLNKLKIFELDKNEKKLKILIPENLDYTEIFDDIFEKYLEKVHIEKVKTTNMGSMYEIVYSVVLKDNNLQKEFLDNLRIRNGNLNISLSREEKEETL